MNGLERFRQRMRREIAGATGGMLANLNFRRRSHAWMSVKTRKSGSPLDFACRTGAQRILETLRNSIQAPERTPENDVQPLQRPRDRGAELPGTDAGRSEMGAAVTGARCGRSGVRELHPGGALGVASEPGLEPRGQLALIGDAQLGLDGRAYSLERPLPALSSDKVASVASGLPAEKREQLAFSFEDGAVQLPLHLWREETANAIEALSPQKHAKYAQRMRDCGRPGIKRCTKCHAPTGKVGYQSSCDSRVCPLCAKDAVKDKRTWLVRAMMLWPLQNRGDTWWLQTYTLRHPPGTSIRRLREDFELVFRGFKQGVWPVLQSQGANRAFLGGEVGPHGNVHVHVLIHGPFMRVEPLRAAWQLITGSSWIHVRRVVPWRTARHDKRFIGMRSAAAELAKYICKGLGSNSKLAEQTHPTLAAQVAIAWHGRNRFRYYGSWHRCQRCGEQRSKHVDERCADGGRYEGLPKISLVDEGPRPWTCSKCGHDEHAFFPLDDMSAGARAPPKGEQNARRLRTASVSDRD